MTNLTNTLLFMSGSSEKMWQRERVIPRFREKGVLAIFGGNNCDWCTCCTILCFLQSILETYPVISRHAQKIQTWLYASSEKVKDARKNLYRNIGILLYFHRIQDLHLIRIYDSKIRFFETRNISFSFWGPRLYFISRENRKKCMTFSGSRMILANETYFFYLLFENYSVLPLTNTTSIIESYPYPLNHTRKSYT